ncbi:protein LIAT1 [Hemibagrus wyckioides]|uniref:protein LIAT1 n=1 Tax=Hemibagrus wyckioides TaxID=337641 RepID=UPI00266C1228|nr:protein LIAT1 [Hemibagrus wyckioides]
MATLTGKLRDPREGIQSTRRGDHHNTPAAGSAGKEGKKKKRKNTTKEKNKPIYEQKKRGHPSTPSHSDDSEKPQTQQSTNTEQSSDLIYGKGQAKERSARKCRKGKSTQPAVEEPPAPDKEDKTDVSSQTQESLRWEGVLDDPVAEAERLEVYKANRRKRYMAFKQTLLENTKVALSSESDGNKLGRTCKAGSATIM